ncbi:hypothetical protein AYR62_11070 [Secundilactobacillus paracollinoides]|uniref:Uncharacterized protein n=1 Tax=Secundilactobacillus paracollinoides TaxID=240427 RepID=A0A1B2IXX7_9LACO|nr:hypothetical protein [Secundilactobacillus paracollinoides]ANZ64572.1 hypothetical protein AYR62_11070 [Secundilactobacillus paracollinoides]ANZ66925.1 hypothetical protein AYR63_07135 [Secundilactobacillus paracollinoides]KRL76976.1 hypothetical protein FC17_GL001430 [Secundilactobacillus paracollinoides DSM 15502 = JCM 11969]
MTNGLFKKALIDSYQWIMVGIVIDIIFEPLDYIFGHEFTGIFGLAQTVLQAPNIWLTLLVVVGILVVLWVVLVLVFWFFEWLKLYMGKDDVYKP